MKLIWEKVNNKYYSRYNDIFNIIVSFSTSKSKGYVKIIGDIGVYPNYTHKFSKSLYVSDTPICFGSHEESFQAEAEIFVFNFLKDLKRKLN